MAARLMAITLRELLQSAERSAAATSSGAAGSASSSTGAPSSTGSPLWDMLGALCFVRIPVKAVQDDYRSLMEHLAARSRHVNRFNEPTCAVYLTGTAVCREVYGVDALNVYQLLPAEMYVRVLGILHVNCYSVLQPVQAQPHAAQAAPPETPAQTGAQSRSDDSPTSARSPASRSQVIRVGRDRIRDTDASGKATVSVRPLDQASIQNSTQLATVLFGWGSVFNHSCVANVQVWFAAAVSYTHLTLPTNREV